MNNIIVAKKFYLRLKGLMFTKEVNYGLLIPKCKSIHTFFMKFNIDVIVLNQDNKIIFIYKNIKPNKLLFIKRNKKMTNILEIPSHLKYKYQLYDQIIWE